MGDWQDQAKCRERPDLFAPPDTAVREGARARVRREREAVKICWECPVWRQCQQWALEDVGQQHTVCGGLTPRELRRLRRERTGRVA